MRNLTSYRSAAKTRVDLIITVIIFLAALVIRLIPWDHVFYAGKTYFSDPDCYVRFRKILVYLTSFPATKVYDYFQGFPVGTGIISPPTMEYLIASIAYPFRSFPMLIPIIERTTALMPPLLGGVTVALLFCFMKRYFSLVPAVVAAGFLAVFPPHAEATLLGRFDNEMTEPLMLLIISGIYCRTYERDDNNIHWILIGFLSALYLTLWRGAVFPLSIIGIDLVLRSFDNRCLQGELNRIRTSAGMMYMTTTAIIFLICVTDVWGTRHTFSYNIVSNFHALLFLSAGIFFLLARLLLHDLSRRKKYILAVGFCAGIILLFIIFWANISEGLRVLSGGNPWLDSIAQYQRGYGVKNIYYYGVFVYISPLFLLLLRNKTADIFPAKRFLVIWTLVMFAAMIARIRFGTYYGLNAAILGGIMVYHIQNIEYFALRKQAVYAVIASLILFQLPTRTFFVDLFRSGSKASLKGDIEETMDWLRENTPKAGHPYKPYIKPAYGILAKWDFGGFIESVAQRPSIATTYGTETYGMEEVGRFFLCAEEAEMREILDRNGVRYVLINDVFKSLPMYAGLVGIKNHPAREYPKLIVSRLFYSDGSMINDEGTPFAPVEGMKLVFESSSPYDQFRIKVFDYAKGATLSIKGVPGKAVSVSQSVETNQGRRFVYLNRKAIGVDGIARFDIQYRAKKSHGTTGALEPVSVIYDSAKITAQVSDADIELKRTVNLSLR